MKRLKKRWKIKSLQAKCIQMLLLFICSIKFESYAQVNNDLIDNNQIEVVKLIVKNYDYKKAVKSNVNFYLAINYDFTDSININIDRNCVFKGKLIYQQVDTTSSMFPYNRRLIRLVIPNGKYDSKNLNCRIIFLQMRKQVNFGLNRLYKYYNMDIVKEKKEWYLTLLNTYPWPD